MFCEHCRKENGTEVALLSIPELLGIQIRTSDFDLDGKPFYVCPVCYTCDNTGLKEERALIMAMKRSDQLISNRVKRSIIQTLSYKHNGWDTDSERKEFIADVTNEAKLIDDEKCFEYIAKRFNVPTLRVAFMFHHVIRLRTHYRPAKRTERNWYVVKANV